MKKIVKLYLVMLFSLLFFMPFAACDVNFLSNDDSDSEEGMWKFKDVTIDGEKTKYPYVDSYEEEDDDGNTIKYVDTYQEYLQFKNGKIISYSYVKSEENDELLEEATVYCPEEDYSTYKDGEITIKGANDNDTLKYTIDGDSMKVSGTRKITYYDEDDNKVTKEIDYVANLEKFDGKLINKKELCEGDDSTDDSDDDSDEEKKIVRMKFKSFFNLK